MKQEEIKEEVIQYWMNKAAEALASATSEQNAGRFSFAINRAYYACFYSASSVLMRLGKRFKKHTGVRASFQESVINTGMVDHSWGRFYKWMFENRQRGDYQELTEFSETEVQKAIFQAQEFIDIILELLKKLPSEQTSEEVFSTGS